MEKQNLTEKIVRRSGMIVQRTEEHVLVKCEKGSGEYHFSLEEFDSRGVESAVEFAKEEIAKKNKSGQYEGLTINFNQARALGFCEYGIKDFCSKLGLSLEEDHKVSDVYEKLTAEAFLAYSEECEKLFGKNIVPDRFGGAKKFLSEHRTAQALNYVLEGGFIDERNLHLLACEFAERVLPIFEEAYPDDNRCRRALEVKRLWTEEQYKDVQ